MRSRRESKGRLRGTDRIERDEEMKERGVRVRGGE